MRKYLNPALILFLCFNTLLIAQTKTSPNDSSIVRLHGWVTFKTFSKNEKSRTIYLLKGTDTLKTYNHGGDISNGAISQGMFWHGFNYDSIKPSQDLVLYIKKKNVKETGEVYLFNKNSKKKLSNFIETKDGYKCSLLSLYWGNLTDFYKKPSVSNISPNLVLTSQTKTTSIDSSIVKLHVWITFKNYAKKETPRVIYLLKGNDTIAKHNDLNDYSDGGIRNGYYWRSFWVDSLKLSDDLAFYIKKRTKSETGEVFLFNSKSTKKLAQFTESSDGYKCSVIPYYYKFITTNYFNTKITTPIPINSKIDNIVAKLLYGEKKNIPLSNTKVFLVSTNGDTIRTTETDEFGDFEFMKVNTQNTNIAVFNNDKIKNEKEIYLAKQNGTIISTLRKTSNGFAYRLLDVDITRLNELETEDEDLKMSSFKNSTEKTITVSENIYYSNNEYKITPDISKILDVTVNNLAKNNTYKLEIYSHTDSRGDDAANLELSIKRANAVLDYLASKGIDRKRLTAKGMGETTIINRCGNGVSCSEKEHELNRRTEFKFIK